MDPLLFCARCFSSWFSIQVLMVLILIVKIIVLALSGWLTLTNGGDFANLVYGVNGTQPLLDWKTEVCGSMPYNYLVPFAFDYSNPSGYKSPTMSYCGYPNNLSAMRFVLATVGFVTVLALFFNTPLSFVARPIFATYALLYFAVAVLDINVTATGQNACWTNFDGTEIYTIAMSYNFTLNCQQGSYVTICIFDLIMSAQFFFIYTAWLFCNDKYVRKPGNHTHDQAELINPMHA